MDPINVRNRKWGLYFVLFALFQFLVFCAGFSALGLALGGTFAAQGDEDLTSYTIAALAGLIALVTSPLLLILGAIGGMGMRSERAWARLVAIIGAIVSLIEFPIGTVFGALALRFLFAPETKNFYNEVKQRGS